ncbi:MAG TPA: methyltransferase [Candidatus Acidoferrales bacterium]|nr:methyltransferase [Candidatus Acidoferrales bacterium]
MESTTAVQQSPLPQAVVLQMVMGARVSKIISDVTRLNVPDVLKQHGSMSAAKMVARHGIDARPEFLERALRAGASLGLFTEDAVGEFGPTELSDALTSDSPVSVKKFVECFGGSWWRVWTGLYDAMRTGEPQARNQVGMEWWDYLKANPKEMEDFGEAMKANSLSSMNGVLERCDFTGTKKVVDVGGGFGHLLVALLEKYPGLQGAMLDVPDLIPIAKKSFPQNDPGIASRLEYIGGDMFESVPPAQDYVMKHIIHDWDDERCIQLLRNCHQSMAGDGRVICVDAVLPPMGDTGGTPAKLLECNIMVFIPGKERTRAQWEELYRAAGFRIRAITPLQDNFGTSIVEGVKK